MRLRRRYGVTPTFFRCPPDLTEMLLEADAAVVIGDVALRAVYEAPAKGLIVTDLGEDWRGWARLALGFAGGGGRRPVPPAHPGGGEGLHQAVPRPPGPCPSR